MGGGEDTAGSVEDGPEVVPPPRLDFARVDRHPDAQRLTHRPVLPGELELDRPRGGHGGADVREGGVEPVPDPLDDPAAGSLHAGVHDLVVPRDSRSHRLRLELPQRRGVLDVHQQEGDDLDLRLDLEQERLVVVEDPVLQLPKLRRGLEP